MFANLPIRNNTSFSFAVAAAIDQYGAAKKSLAGEHKALKFHQYMVIDYMLQHKLRGMYIFHMPGSGKSRLSVALAEALAQASGDFKIMYVCSKSLHSNMREEAMKYYRELGLDEDEATARLAKLKFVSSNAGNMLEQLRFTQSDEIDLNGVIVIIDEFHEVCNAIVNGSKNAIGFYNAVMAMRKGHVVGLSGTPISSEPYEFAVGMNMICGYMDGGVSDNLRTNYSRKHGLTLFGENYESFAEYFINRPEALEVETSDRAGSPLASIKNREKFVARCLGLVSAYNPRETATGVSETLGERKAAATGTDSQYPTQLPMVELTIPMSKYQFGLYKIAREQEIAEAKRRIFAPKVMISHVARQSGGSSTYRVASRQLGNFAYPSTASKFEMKGGKLQYTRDVAALTDADLTTGLHRFSMKLCVLMANLVVLVPELANNRMFNNTATAGKAYAIAELNKVAKSVDDKVKIVPGLGVIYSQFNESGIAVIARVLEANGMQRLRVEQPKGLAAGRKVTVGEDVNRRAKASEQSVDDIDTDEMQDTPMDESTPEDVKSVVDAATKVGGKERDRQLQFGVIDGSVEIWERDAIRAIFLSEENLKHKFMPLLLFTATGATGTNTKGVTHVHIFEPYWKPNRHHQVETRANRLGSHIHLPKSEQYVLPLIYLATYPEVEGKLATEAIKGVDQEQPELTTDMQLYSKAKQLEIVNETFTLAIQSASFDCSIWSGAALHQRGLKCHMCAPTDQQLFIEDIVQDIEDPTDRCKAPQTSDVKAVTIEYEGQKYAYYKGVEGEVVLVEYQPSLNGYMKIGPSHPHYDVLYAKADTRLRKHKN